MSKNVKQVSRLTSSLLARKGSAAPSPGAMSMNQQVINRFATSQHEPEQPVNVSKRKISTREPDAAKSSKEPAVNKRIAMTVRMDEESHLKLRIFSAHTGKSCQVILSEALDLYLEQNGDKVPMEKIASQHR